MAREKKSLKRHNNLVERKSLNLERYNRTVEYIEEHAIKCLIEFSKVFGSQMRTHKIRKKKHLLHIRVVKGFSGATHSIFHE